MIINDMTLYLASPIKEMLPTKERFNGVSHGLSEAGYDIRVKQDIWFSGYYSHNGLRQDPTGTLDKDEFFGSFTLASAIEEFDMPNNLVGVVHDKSTWARQGLSVFNTVIEPGWKGFLTLELVYHGQDELFIPAGSGIAQVLFHRTIRETAYNGKYQHQADEPVTSIFESAAG